jgi:pimeloyl-[acyl-carrier protein] methyl ester esterase
MTRPTLLLLHGWGFDATLWDGLRAALPDYAAVAWDRGYFGAPSAPVVAGPVLTIGHSLGALLFALDPLPDWVGLVAINGFDRFTGKDAVPPRVVERMRMRFAETPREVLTDFRTRCGTGEPPASLDTERLAADLALLAEADARSAVLPPTLVLHGADDPILPATLRIQAFCSPAAAGVQNRPQAIRPIVAHLPQAGPRPLPGKRTVESVVLDGAGHLLPLTHPEWCADRIQAFAA